MADFPEDVVVEIFRRLPYSGHVQACFTLCKSWRAFFKGKKLSRLLFTSLWDPEQCEFDYSSDTPPGNSSWRSRHLRLAILCQKLVDHDVGAPATEVWRNNTGSRNAICWFTANNDNKLVLTELNRLVFVQTETGTVSSDPAPLPFQGDYVGSSYQSSRENRFFMCEKDKEAHFIEKRTLRQFAASYWFSNSTKYRSINSKNLTEYSCTEGRVWKKGGKYDSGYVNNGTTQVRAAAISTDRETTPTTTLGNVWVTTLTTHPHTVILSGDRWLILLDHKTPEAARIIILDATTGVQVSAIPFAVDKPIHNVAPGAGYFLADNRCVIAFQRTIILLEIETTISEAEDGKGQAVSVVPKILSHVSHDGEVFGPFCVRYNMLFIEAHPEQWYFARESSTLLVYRIHPSALQLVRVCGMPSVGAIAVDSELMVYGTSYDTPGIFKMQIV